MRIFASLIGVSAGDVQSRFEKKMGVTEAATASDVLCREKDRESRAAQLA